MKTHNIDGIEYKVIDYTVKNEHNYPRLTCPNCKRSFYWDKKSKGFNCICGEKLCCGDDVSSN